MKRIFIFFLSVSVALFIRAQPALLNLMPVPRSAESFPGKCRIDKNFSIAIKTPNRDILLLRAVNHMYQKLNRRTGLCFKQEFITLQNTDDSARFLINVDRAVLPEVGIEESYDIHITDKEILLHAPNTIGILHGLETILQLLSEDENGFYFPAVKINDTPRFAWRGLMIDVARHFIPSDVIRRNIEAMAALKMNVLHLHLSGNEGFRMESKIYPDLHGKGSNDEYYRQTEIKDIIDFAGDRGIIVVPEFDMPGHSRSWFAGYPELASAPGPYRPGKGYEIDRSKPLTSSNVLQQIKTFPTPAFDPTKESTYDFLDHFIAEMASLFPSPYFHIGADENNGVVWNNNPNIRDFMQKNNIPDVNGLQSYFVQRVVKIVRKYNKQVIGWEELFSKDLDTGVIVQVWDSRTSAMLPIQIAAQGNLQIDSRGYYLDLFMPAYFHYMNDPFPPGMSDSLSKKILGGEAAMWTELANSDNIETRIWPRAAAIAERFWSPASVTDKEDMYRRMSIVSRSLDENGLQYISNYERMLRRLAGDSENYEEIKTLVDVLSPIRGYKRIMALYAKPENAGYQTAPMLEVADIAWVDPETRRLFRMLVERYLRKPDTQTEKAIRGWLNKWQNNHESLACIFTTNTKLREIETHSSNLAAASKIGLKALEFIKKGIQAPPAWKSEKLKFLREAAKPSGEVELSIVPEIVALVEQQITPEIKNHITH